MNRHVVRVAVLTALGTTLSAASAGIPDGPIPELENTDSEQTDAIGAPPPDLAERVAQRWAKHHRSRFEAIATPAQLAQADEVVKTAHTWLPKPMAGTMTYGAWKADLATDEGRIDTVLFCLSTGMVPDRCDFSGVKSPEEAAAIAGGARNPGTPVLDLNKRWHGLVVDCPDPTHVGGCSGQLSVDAVTGQCYQEQLCRRGRPFGEGQVATLEGDTRTAAGDAWARVALEEHASVASFARHVLELMAVGAPTELVMEATRAQLDEVRHAELALGLARHFGAEVTIGALDTQAPPCTRLVDVLISVARDGCVGETLSATECAIALEQTEDPRVREVLEAIVADESRHAALAWRTLAWGLPRLDHAERAQVLAELEAHAVTMAPECPAGIGVLGGSEAAAARAWAFANVVEPARAALS